MSPEITKPRRKRAGIEHEEERAWVGFYRRVRSDAAIAAEVMAQLDADPEMKRAHLALYLCCKQSLRADKARQQRNRRIGAFVRWLCHGVFVVPAIAFQRAMRGGGHLAVECLPVASGEPAVPKVRKLAREPEFAAAQTAFQQQTAPVVAGPDTTLGTARGDAALPSTRKTA